MHQLHLQTCQKQLENTIIKTYIEVFYHTFLLEFTAFSYSS